jgi:toxin-antitoxin system PIN domain toxin
MIYLLDVNVLIAMADPAHVHHAQVQLWFHAQPGRGWATCPLTENTFLRILSVPSYPGSPGDPMAVRQLLTRMCAFPGHQFWPDHLTLNDAARFPALPAFKHLTDLYLLALAVSHHGKLATLDRRIDPNLLPNGTKAYFLIP